MAALLPLFFISGACGLVYEVVWTRLLGLAVGHTTYALTAVVAAFMGGLAAGSAVFGRRIAAGVNPMRLYVALEVGVAVFAVAFPAPLSAVTMLSAAAGRHLLGDLWLLSLLRFLLAAAAVAPATFLMGGTLPAMIALASRRDGHIARHTAVLYAINTIGAVVGATTAGFFLIERLGTREATLIAATGNAVVALLVWWMTPQSHRELLPQRPQTPQRPQRTQRLAVSVRSVPSVAEPSVTEPSVAEPSVAEPSVASRLLFAYGLCGFSALALEIIWTRALVFYAGTTTYAFTSMLVVFLAGITVGSAAAAPFIERMRKPAVWFVAIQAALAVAAALSLRAVHLASPRIDILWPPDQSWVSLVAGNFAKAASAMFVPTVLMGAALPIAVKLGIPQARTRGEDATGIAGAVLGALYAANTAGGILGAATAGLLLVPSAGLAGATGIAAGLTLAAAAIVAWTVRENRLPRVAALAAAGVLVAVASRGGQLHVPVGSEKLVFYEEGAASTVSVLQEVTGTRTIYIDRVPVAGTDLIMLTDQKSLAHVPMLLNPAAKRVLTVGFGSGGASWSFSRHSGVERIDCLEIDPSVFHAAPYLEASNHAVWRDRRFHLILEDARNYLASTDATYDIISTDCTDLRYKSNASLYTTDYFALCRRRLRPKGIVTVWMPLGGLGGDTFRMALRTFRSVFPHTTVWYMNNLPTHYLLLVGSASPLEADLAAFVRALQDAAVRADLAEIRLDDPLKLASSLLLDEAAAARLAGDGPLNTDAHPLLEFEAPRLAYRDALVANLRAAVEARRPAEDGQSLRWRGPPAEVAALGSYLNALPALVEGHALYQRGSFDYGAALRLYRSAAVANPADRSIPPLIADVEHTRQTWLDEFAARTAAGSRDSRDWLALSTLRRQTGRPAEAVDAARRAVALAPTSAEAHVKLAAALSAAGRTAEAAATLERIRTAASTDPVVLTDLGAAYNEQDRFDAAEAVLRRALAIAPDSADAHNNLGVALNGLRRPGDAIGELQRAIALDRSSPEAWFNLGVALASSGRTDQARLAYGRGLALAPGDARALYNLALIEAQAGRFAEAARRLREAVEREPASAEMRNDLGRLYLRLDRPADALAELERARQLDPDSAAIAQNLRLASDVLERQRSGSGRRR